jgi:hypothetical protein
MQYNRSTIRHFTGLISAIALTLAVCLLLLYETESLPRAYVPKIFPQFPSIAIQAPGTTGIVLQVLANSNAQVVWNGAVIWQCINKMTSQKPYSVVLRVEKGRLDDFERGLDQSISRKKYGVAIGTRTEAELSGEDFSIILQQANHRQIVGLSTYQEWVWQVTPKSSGPHRLLLTVSPIAQLKDVVGGGIDGETPVGTPFRDSKDIDVALNWANFFREQIPQWTNIAIGTLLGVLVTVITALIGENGKI